MGVVANNGELGWQEGLKGAHFVRLAALRSIPLLFFVNTTSDKHFLSSTGSDGNTAKGHAQLMASIVSADVPKITVVLGGAYGTGYYAMVRTLLIIYITSDCCAVWSSTEPSLPLPLAPRPMWMGRHTYSIVYPAYTGTAALRGRVCAYVCLCVCVCVCRRQTVRLGCSRSAVVK